MSLEKRVERLERIKPGKKEDFREREFFEKIIDAMTENEKNKLFDIWEKYEIPEGGCLGDMIELMSKKDKELHNELLESAIKRMKE